MLNKNIRLKKFNYYSDLTPKNRRLVKDMFYLKRIKSKLDTI
jgi:hypothetical protein